MNSLKFVALAATSMLVAVPAFAQDAAPASPPDFTVTGGVTGITQYRFRGVSLSNEKPALQGTITVNHSSGLYAGTWGSNLAGFGDLGGNHIEVDLYAGYGHDWGNGIKTDAGLLYYWYPGHRSPDFDTDSFEPYASLTYSIGPAAIKVGGNYAWKQKAIGDRANLYLYAEPSFALPKTPVTLKAHVGHSSGHSTYTFGGANYWDWSIGADVKLFGPLTANVSYIDTNLKKNEDLGGSDFLADQTDAAIVASISASF